MNLDLFASDCTYGTRSLSIAKLIIFVVRPDFGLHLYFFSSIFLIVLILTVFRFMEFSALGW